MSKEYIRPTVILGQLPIAGQIVLTENFENLLNWTKIDGEGDSIFELDPTIAKQGKQSLHLKTRTTGTDTGDIIGAQRLLHLLPAKVMSFLFSFLTPDYTKINDITLQFLWNDYVTVHTASFMFRPNTPDWRYYGSDDQFHDIPNLAIELYQDAWHLINLKINLAADLYISHQVDHLTADLTGVAVHTTTPSPASYLKTLIQFSTIGAAPAELYLDDILIHEI